MAYNRENLLIRIVEIQDIVKEHKKHDTPQKTIWEKHIYPRYYISYSTFNEYMVIPAYAQLKLLRQKKEEQKKQNPTLF
ncbi:MAG: hypothetical protein LBN27_01800 [Prevotellaceae bacterium]|jgi:hypothetical protein|nr:hypothetical protein [Prevotellaceae bacterium]